MSQLTPENLAFRKQDTIGVNDAADDKEYLLNCFIDLGDLELLKEFRDPKCILLGRTGAGKTALVTKLQADMGDRVIVVDPEALAMQHISNSTIIKYLVELDIDLNTFFKLLWRHEICVEIFTRHIKATSETDHANFIEKVRYEFKKRNPKHLKALDYLEEWKNTFWKTSESHVTEMVSKTETEVSGAVGATSEVLSAKLQGTNKLSEEEKTKIRHLGQTIVNDVQMREVTGLLDMLNDFVEFHQKQYYIVLDKLDEKWVGNDLRYKLIKSLIETVRDLNRLSNIKPIIVLRHDLLGKVFDLTRDTGFQEEKYTPLYLDVRWSRDQLVDLVNSRINYLFRSRYSKRKLLTYNEILPAKVQGVSTIDYMLDRTLMRPRDIIDFFNECIKEVSTGTGVITEETVLDAEVNYSYGRLDSLTFEWFADYPGLKGWTSILRKLPHKFSLKHIDDEALLERCMEYAVNPSPGDKDSEDIIHALVIGVDSNAITLDDFKKQLLYAFYRMNLVGIKHEGERNVNWSQLRGRNMEWRDIETDAEFVIHPCYRSALRTVNVRNEMEGTDSGIDNVFEAAMS